MTEGYKSWAWQNHDITILVAMVTSNESANTTEAAIKLLDDTEKQPILKEQEIHRNGGTLSGTGRLCTLAMIRLKISII
jgi:hypothetical protein